MWIAALADFAVRPLLVGVGRAVAGLAFVVGRGTAGWFVRIRARPAPTGKLPRNGGHGITGISFRMTLPRH